MDSDALRSVRNAFYLGLYSEVAKEAQQLPKDNKEACAWGEVFVARAQLAVNPASFQPSANAPTALQAVKQLGTFLSTEEDQHDMVFDTVKEWLSSPDLSKDVTLQLMASQMYLAAGRLKDALSLVHGADASENLEKLSMQVQIYLRMDRPDLAAKSLKAMQDLDDDDTLTQLTCAWIGLSSGAVDKVTEAAFLLQELLEKFGPSVVVLNSLAVAEIQQRNYAQAFAYTKQARDLSLKAGAKVSAETLLNSIVCLQHLRKGADIIDKITAELKAAYPRHPWIKKQQEMEQQFEKQAETFKHKQ